MTPSKGDDMQVNDADKFAARNVARANRLLEPVMQVNDIVIFSPRQGETAEGIVTRVWDKPAGDPFVTIKTGDGGPSRTFVRCSSEVITGQRFAPHDEGTSYCTSLPEHDDCTGTGA